MSPDLIAGGLIVLAFIAGLVVGAHNAKTVAADIAVLKNDVATLKEKAASTVAKA